MTMSLELVREFESFHSADRRFVNYRNALISAFNCNGLITAGARSPLPGDWNATSQQKLEA